MIILQFEFTGDMFSISSWNSEAIASEFQGNIEDMPIGYYTHVHNMTEY